MSNIYSADGYTRVSVSDGSGWKGRYAPDGSLWVTESPGDATTRGLYAPDGSMYVTVVDGTTFTGLYAPDGSLNVILDQRPYGGALSVTVVSGSLGGPWTPLALFNSSQVGGWYDRSEERRVGKGCY
jgi:hypothetical protein